VLEKHWSGDDHLLHALQKVAEISDEVVSKIPVKSAIAQFVKQENKDK